MNYLKRQRVKYLAPVVLATIDGMMLWQSPTLVKADAQEQRTAIKTQQVTFYVQPQYQLDRDGSWANVPGTRPIKMTGTVGEKFEAPALKNYVPANSESNLVPKTNQSQGDPIKIRYRSQSTGLYTATVNINYVESKKRYVMSTDIKTLHYADKVTLVPKQIEGYILDNVELPNQYFVKNPDNSVTFTFQELKDPTYKVTFFYLPKGEQGTARTEPAEPTKQAPSQHVVGETTSEVSISNLPKPLTPQQPEVASTGQIPSKNEKSDGQTKELAVDHGKPTQPVTKNLAATDKPATEATNGDSQPRRNKTEQTEKEKRVNNPGNHKPAVPELRPAPRDHKTANVVSQGPATPVVTPNQTVIKPSERVQLPTKSSADLVMKSTVTAKTAKAEHNGEKSAVKGSQTHEKSSTLTRSNMVSEKAGKLVSKGTVVYALKRIGLYKSVNFAKYNRLFSYAKQKRHARPMFVVTGYARSKNGQLRYRVRDVNHLSRSDGKRGYITANEQYVRPVYYQGKHTKIRVINPRGVKGYRHQNLTGHVTTYRYGKLVRPVKIVRYHLTTRFVLKNGQYITANRKLVKSVH